MHTLSPNQHIQAIVKAIKFEEKKLRARHTFLAHQNTLGLIIVLTSLGALIGLGTLYYLAVIPAWLCIIAAAIVTSISHEMEHDLIHKQYFGKHPIMHNLLMLIVWCMRPNTINPWFRRKIHLHHHKVSGTDQDIEERLVGNGTKKPFIRAVIVCDGLLSLMISGLRMQKEIKGFRFLTIFNAGFPLATAYFVMLYGFLGFHLLNFLAIPIDYPQWLLSNMSWINLVMVTLIFPNVLRSASLNLVTSSMHYYGGVNNLLQQTHVLTHWAFAPFQLFCFNFGATHTIHHFIPNQPFYIRQWISKQVLPIMATHGVRFNDLASLKYANLYR